MANPTRSKRAGLLYLLLLLGTAGLAGQTGAEILTQRIISLEDPRFVAETAWLVAGHDGRVYLTLEANAGLCLSIQPDGSDKHGLPFGHAQMLAAVRADGAYAVRCGHFTHTVKIFDRAGTELGEFKDFDNRNFNAPQAIEVGASGDFYAADHYANRIIRLDERGRVLKVYPIPTGWRGDTWAFRVCEAKSEFIVLTQNKDAVVYGFDGQQKGTLRLAGEHFDVDEQGIVYSIPDRDDGVIREVSLDGENPGQIKLQIPRDCLPKGDRQGWASLRLLGTSEVLLKRRDAAELFQRYDLKTGALLGVVSIDHERLSVRCDSDTWTGGEAARFEVNFESRHPAPVLHVWAKPWGTSAWVNLAWSHGFVQIPADLAGLYQVKVSDELDPMQSGRAATYSVQMVVEIRSPQAKGSATVLSENNRLAYGRGEAIPVAVLIRAADADVPRQVEMRLSDADRVVVRQTVDVQDKRAAVTFPTQLTSRLQPGTYRVEVAAPHLTCVSQTLEIGPGLTPVPFSRIFHGDMGNLTPRELDAMEAADRLSAFADSIDQLGINFIAERIDLRPPRLPDGLEDLRKRLAADPLATAPERVEEPGLLLQALALYGARGIEDTPIFLGNDAGIPLGSPLDSRPPEQMAEQVRLQTKTMQPYPAFPGWDWAVTWWNYNLDPPEAMKSAYQQAAKRAEETGVWDPVLDQVADHRSGLNNQAIEFLNKALREVDSNRLVAVAAPYRRLDFDPARDFAQVDETDLHYQCEQIPAPFYMAHEVDLYSRPGKRAWGHAEIYNESGTGDQVWPANFMMLMRGPSGTGVQSGLPTMFNAPSDMADSRVSSRGGLSLVRSLNGVLQRYGPWLTRTARADQVAIAASSRMFQLDCTPGSYGPDFAGRHFLRLVEAYMACLENHTPATIIWSDDLAAEGFKGFKAVLVVDQRCEPEPKLAAALRDATAAGVRVFYDGLSRAAFVPGGEPVGIAFNHFDDSIGANSADMAYKLMPERLAADLPALRQTLSIAAPAFASCDNPEVYFSERLAGRGRYVFAVNNTSIPLDYGKLWRVGLFSSCRLPVMADMKLADASGAVYDVFALKQVEPRDGVIRADLRTMPGRLFAILPGKIASLSLSAPKTVGAGGAIQWQARVLDSDGHAIDALIPVRLRLVGSDGKVVEERFDAADSDGAKGEFPVPVNGAGKLTLEAVELFSGITVRFPITVAAAALPLEMAWTPGTSPAATGRITAGDADPKLPPSDASFGLHLRDVAVSTDGQTAVFNAMNWGDNFYGIDLKTGHQVWSRRIGQYFAFAPKEIAHGFAVQGFDFDSAEGYHLYLTDNGGTVQKRFALDGVPGRLEFRFVPHLIMDRVNNFALAGDGSWVASSGDLGVAVWSDKGQLLWSQSRISGDDPNHLFAPDSKIDAPRAGRHSVVRAARVLALDDGTLLLADGMHLSACVAATGKVRWQLDLATSEEVRAFVSSADGKTIGAFSSYRNGVLFIIRDGKVVDTILAPEALECALSADGSQAAVAQDNVLSLHHVGGGESWTFSGRGRLMCPRFSPDGSRVAVSSDLGELYILSSDGHLLHQEDLGSVAALAYLSNGDLLAGDWNGAVRRIDGDFAVRWQTRLSPQAEDASPLVAASPEVPTSRMTDWTNAETQAWPLSPNLLAADKIVPALVTRANPTWQGRAESLFDGKALPPAQPWISWRSIERFAEMSPENWIELDAHNKLLRVSAITLVEDPAHPESWLRTASFEYWDEPSNQWVGAQRLLSDQPIHTHRFAKPVEATRFRILLPWGCVGNLRLAQIVLHGEDLGTSNPDVRAKKPIAVLFDENLTEMNRVYQGASNPGYKPVQAPDAFSGSSYFIFDGERNKALMGTADLRQNSIPAGWLFEIAEHPAPGQYRYLRFAYRAASPNTASLWLNFDGMAKPFRIDHPARQWQTATIDLWNSLDLRRRTSAQTPTLTGITLGCSGGPVAFDQILLAREESDLPPIPKSSNIDAK